MSPEMLDPQMPGRQVEAVSAEVNTKHDPDKRQAWERPALRRLSADLAEAGLLVGSEVLILLRTS